MLRWLSLIVILILLVMIGGVLAVNAGLLNPQIERRVSQTAGAPVKLGRVTIKIGWPLTVHIGASTIEHPLAHVEFRSLDLSLASFRPPYDVGIKLSQPKVQMKELPKTPAQQAARPSAGASKSTVPLIQLDFAMDGGEFDYGQIKATNISLDFDQKLLLKTPARVRFKAGVLAPFLPTVLPISIESDSLTLSEETIKSEATRTMIGGMTATLTGGSLLKEDRHRWLVSLHAPDLSKLPQPPLELPAKNWKGAVDMTIEILKENAQKSWSAAGSVQIKDMGAQMSWNKQALVITGPVILNSDFKFLYADDKFTLNKFSGQINLTSARVQVAEMLDKPAGVLFSAAAQASGDMQDLKLARASVALAQLKANFSGETQMVSPWKTKAQGDLAPVSLKGLDALLVPLRKSPVQGELAAQAEFDGLMTDPAAAHIVVKNLSLKNFLAQVDLNTAPTVQLRGPLRATVQARADLQGKQLKSAQASGQISLAGAAMVLGPLRKESNQSLSANFSLRNQGTALQIDNLEMKGFFGLLRLKGRVSDFTAPQLDTTLEAAPLDLSELRNSLPTFRDGIPKGQVRGQLKAVGQVAFAQAWNEWPLTVTGQLKATVPEYQMSAPAQATPQAPGAPPPPPPATEAQPFLPNGFLTSKLNVKISADVDRFIKDKLIAKKVSVNGDVTEGHFRGGVRIGDIFGGSAHVTDLNVPLLIKNPSIEGKAAWGQINVADALEFAKPESKTLASGRAQGSAAFETVLPSEPEFLNLLKVKGDATLAPITLSTVKIGEMINGLLAKVPGLKANPVKVEPWHGQIRGQYELSKGTLQIASLSATDVDNSELQMKGTVVLANLEGDLAGSYHWAKPTLTGCALEGNADPAGRMVIPLAMKGSLMNPGFSILTDVVGTLAGRALECEKKKLIDRVRAEGTDKLKKEVNKALKGIFGQ